jgi:hypothetical protein
VVEAILFHRPKVRVHVRAPAHLALLHATLDLLSLFNSLRHFDQVRIFFLSHRRMRCYSVELHKLKGLRFLRNETFKLHCQVNNNSNNNKREGRCVSALSIGTITGKTQCYKTYTEIFPNFTIILCYIYNTLKYFSLSINTDDHIF